MASKGAANISMEGKLGRSDGRDGRDASRWHTYRRCPGRKYSQTLERAPAEVGCSGESATSTVTGNGAVHEMPVAQTRRWQLRARISECGRPGYQFTFGAHRQHPPPQVGSGSSFAVDKRVGQKARSGEERGLETSSRHATSTTGVLRSSRHSLEREACMEQACMGCTAAGISGTLDCMAGLAWQVDLGPLWEAGVWAVGTQRCWRRRMSQLMCGMDGTTSRVFLDSAHGAGWSALSESFQQGRWVGGWMGGWVGGGGLAVTERRTGAVEWSLLVGVYEYRTGGLQQSRLGHDGGFGDGCRAADGANVDTLDGRRRRRGREQRAGAGAMDVGVAVAAGVVSVQGHSPPLGTPHASPVRRSPGAERRRSPGADQTQMQMQMLASPAQVQMFASSQPSTAATIPHPTQCLGQGYNSSGPPAMSLRQSPGCRRGASAHGVQTRPSSSLVAGCASPIDPLRLRSRAPTTYEQHPLLPMVHHVDTSIAFLHRDTSIAFLHRDTSIAFMHHVLARALLNAPSHRLASARSDANVRQRWCFAVAADVIAITPGSLRRFFQNADRSHLHIRLTSASRPILDPLVHASEQHGRISAPIAIRVRLWSHPSRHSNKGKAYIAAEPCAGSNSAVDYATLRLLYLVHNRHVGQNVRNSIRRENIKAKVVQHFSSSRGTLMGGLQVWLRLPERGAPPWRAHRDCAASPPPSNHNSTTPTHPFNINKALTIQVAFTALEDKTPLLSRRRPQRFSRVDDANKHLKYLRPRRRRRRTTLQTQHTSLLESPSLPGSPQEPNRRVLELGRQTMSQR
ncbi:hypothetical protein PMIN01_03216 [Paraphaeosphaeria minitans]|uniref:Uncharacterized protein n=1 Tax=Paraphaeosphaeria minitans TaxID=565426 RepID=A0A9P6KSK4_9PLEO|nr:hypothetical protein PMIN01_03216 [Paraphaeosphaeria minitans]